jgi:uridine phosphorylase
MEKPARYQFDQKTITASEREWKTHRLTSYNEKI